jgi:multiple sugar transport system substrate-binding protein
VTHRRAASFVAAVLATGLVGAGAVACGSGGPSASNVQQDTGSPLTIWVRRPANSPTEKTSRELAAKFTQKTGIQTTVVALFDDFETKLQQAAAQKQLPDIVINDTAQRGTLVKQGIVRDLNRNDIEGQDKLTPASWNAATGADGKVNAVPFSAQSFALFIRKDWREKLGLPVPKTWDELRALGKAFTEKDPDGNGKPDTYGFVVPGSTKRGYTAWYYSSFLWSAGGDFLTESNGKYRPAVDSDDSVAAIKWFQDSFCVDKSVVPGAVNLETVPAHPMFETGVGGIYFTGPYNMPRFDKNLGKDKYEVVALPAGEGGKSVSLAEGENIYLMAGSKNQSGQEKFAEYAISVEGQTFGMAGDTDGLIVRLPVNSEVKLGDVRKDTRWQTFEKIYKDGGRYVPSVPEWTPFLQGAATSINAVVANCGADVKAEMSKLASTFSQELNKQGVAG